MLTRVEERLREALSNPHDPYRSQLAVVNSDDGKWPGGIVPYEIDSSLSECTGTWFFDVDIPSWWLVSYIASFPGSLPPPPPFFEERA